MILYIFHKKNIILETRHHTFLIMSIPSFSFFKVKQTIMFKLFHDIILND